MPWKTKVKVTHGDQPSIGKARGIKEWNLGGQLSEDPWARGQAGDTDCCGLGSSRGGDFPLVHLAGTVQLFPVLMTKKLICHMRAVHALKTKGGFSSTVALACPKEDLGETPAA